MLDGMTKSAPTALDLLVDTGRLSNVEGKTFGRPSGLEELTQIYLVDLKSGEHETCLERVRGLVQEYLIIDVDGVAGEGSCVVSVYDDAFVRWHAALDGNARLVIESRRMIQQEAVGQRTEARVDVIEARVRQSDRHNLDIKEIPDFCVRLNLRAETVPGPQPGSTAIKQTVSSALESDLVIKIEQVEPVVPEPVLEVLLFRATFVRHEVARNRLVAVNGAGIRRENHVGQLGLRLNRNDVRKLTDLVAQSGPLLLGPLEA